MNDFLCGLFAGIGIRLVDFKLEFGRIWENDFARIILADEISPDGCRLWDMESGEKLDKDRFRRDLGGEAEAAIRGRVMSFFVGVLLPTVRRPACPFGGTLRDTFANIRFQVSCRAVLTA